MDTCTLSFIQYTIFIAGVIWLHPKLYCDNLQLSVGMGLIAIGKEA
jgi:hypothetical protein